LKRWIVILLLVLSWSWLGVRAAHGSDGPATPVRAPSSGPIVTNMTGLLFAGFLVFFMQTGFALVETGMVRAKNVGHTMAMNLMIYPIGVLGFWACGFAIIEWDLDSLFLAGRSLDMSLLALFLFQLMFMDTAATIPTGSMAERYRFSAFLLLGFFVSMLLYPVYAQWVWGHGWLAGLGKSWGLGHGLVDYAGSSVVHMTGGFTGLVGAWMLGPRIGKYKPSGTPNPMPAHNVPMYMLGTLFLAFGWFGFNTGNSLANNDPISARIAVNTLLASSAGAFASLGYMVLLYQKPDPSFLCNGMLAGLVAVTACCAFIRPWAAVLIGAVSGVLVVWTSLILDRRFHIDDPAGAIAVHGFNGIWGLLALGLFADGTYPTSGAFNGVPGGVAGLFYGDATQLVAQVVGAAVNLAWVLPVSYGFFRFSDWLLGNRVSPHVEIIGLDVPELGAVSYVNQDAKTPEPRLAVQMPIEPRPAAVPPNGAKHFAIVVQGAGKDLVTATWSELCKPGAGPPPPDFLLVYQDMTTVEGNLFRFRGGHPESVRASLQRLLQSHLPGHAIQTQIKQQ